MYTNIDIWERVKPYLIGVRKKGQQYMCFCPFHPETHPSMSINAEKGVYNCFGCGSSGSIIELLMHFTGEGMKEKSGIPWKWKKIEFTDGIGGCWVRLPFRDYIKLSDDKWKLVKTKYKCYSLKED